MARQIQNAGPAQAMSTAGGRQSALQGTAMPSFARASR